MSNLARKKRVKISQDNMIKDQAAVKMSRVLPMLLNLDLLQKMQTRLYHSNLGTAEEMMTLKVLPYRREFK